MLLERIEHIGIAVSNLKTSIPIYEKLLGSKCYNVELVEDQKVNTAFFKIGEVKIELLEATEADSPISNFIEKNGEGVHHIAFQVNDTSKALEKAKENGFRLIDRDPRPGAEDMSIGFLNPKRTAGVLVEFCSPNKS